MTRQDAPADRRQWLLFAAILLLATVLRVGSPQLTEFKFDEARLEALALQLTREGRLPLVGLPSSAGFDHSPVSVYLYLPAFLFTTNPIPATIYGGLVGVAAVALCWWFGRRWPGGGWRAASIAMLLCAVSPWLVAFSRKIWQVAFVPFLTLALIGLAVSALVGGPDASSAKRQPWNLSWMIVVFAVLVQVHPSAISLVPAVLLWLVVFWRRVRIGPLLFGGVLGALTAVPFLLHQVRSGWPLLTAWRLLPEPTWDLLAARLAWEAVTGRSIHALAGNAYPLLKAVPQLDWVFSLIGWLAAGASVWLFWRMVTGWRAADTARQQASKVDLILLSSLVVPVAFNLRHSLELHLHSFALVTPAAYLVIGRAMEAILVAAQASNSKEPGAQPRPGLWPLLGATALGLLATAQVMALVLMARFVATHDTPEGFGTPLGRYLEITDWAIEMANATGAAEVLVVGQGESIVVDAVPAIFDVLLRDKVGYRFVDGQSAAIFPPHRSLVLLTPKPGEASRWYTAWPTKWLVHDLGDGFRVVALDGSWPQEGFDAVAGPRTFQTGIELQGYAWEPDGEDRGQFWLLWQVLWSDPEDTHFSVHLLDEMTLFWGQRDSVGFPTEYRRKGDRVVSLFDITRENPAVFTPVWARAVLYLYPQVVNIPLIDEAGNQIGDAVEMGPLSKSE